MGKNINTLVTILAVIAVVISVVSVSYAFNHSEDEIDISGIVDNRILIRDQESAFVIHESFLDDLRSDLDGTIYNLNRLTIDRGDLSDLEDYIDDIEDDIRHDIWYCADKHPTNTSEFISCLESRFD